MKEIVIISGKGGTGKTSIAAALASLAATAVLADCDVDAADLHLLTAPQILRETEFIGGRQAVIRREDCTRCGLCRRLCRFGAIRQEDGGGIFSVDAVSCEGCKVCVEFCPAGAIDFVDAVNGRWFISETRFGPMVHAELGIAQENSGKLVALLRREARRLAEEQNRDWILSDGSPGIGCPVIASITGVDAALVVTEPTRSGRHDLLRILELTDYFRVPAAVCINKADINPAMTCEIERLALKKNLPVFTKISYDRGITEAQIQAQSIIEYAPGSIAAEQIRCLWNRMQELPACQIADKQKERGSS